MAPLTGGLPVRPAISQRLLMVRTGTCEAACAGAVRAITARFWTAADGVATCDLMFAEPSELCCVGLRPTELVTRAPRNEAAVRGVAPRLMACPLTKVLGFATVTAFTLCAFTKLTL